MKLLRSLIRYAGGKSLFVDKLLSFVPLHKIYCESFFGSGTTAVVARRLGRHYLGIEINPDYIKIAERRIKR